MATDLVSTTALLGISNPKTIVKWEDAENYQSQLSSTIRSFGRFVFTLGDGTVKYIYKFWGTGAPSTTYDVILALATTLPGSEYCDTTTGALYRAILNDSAVHVWVILTGVRVSTAGDTTEFTLQPPAGIAQLDSDSTKYYVKSGAEGVDADYTLL